MPREIVTLQIGQCGNQIGCRFWDIALQEHAKHNKHVLFDDALSSFFRNVDCRFADPLDIPGQAEAPQRIRTLKARAVLVDMEEGVVDSIKRSHLADIFDAKQLITDVSGSGNNWAHGHDVYGPQYHSRILNTVRRSVELCDSLQSFFFIHSLGGGTGSGLGTYILEALEDEYPEIFRFVAAVFPSADDDVVTSPYNSCLAVSKLRAHASCVFPVSNDALIKMCQGVQTEEKRKVFDKMNDVVANLLTNMTSSVRFEGSLNVDLNEITTNLVPYPTLHFILSAMSPVDPKTTPRKFDQTFADVLAPEFQLFQAHPRQSLCMASAFLLRGDVTISTALKNISRVKTKMKLLPCSQDAFKVGLCKVPPLNHPYSLLCLSNSCEVKLLLSRIHQRFMKLFSRKAHVHHYTTFLRCSTELQDASDAVASLVRDYECLEGNRIPTTVSTLQTLSEQPYGAATKLRHPRPSKPSGSSSFAPGDLLMYRPFL